MEKFLEKKKRIKFCLLCQENLYGLNPVSQQKLQDTTNNRYHWRKTGPAILICLNFSGL